MNDRCPDSITLTERIREEYNLHPQSRLKDYYKLAFQALFGPGHLIKDKNSAACYLERELEAMTVSDAPSVQDISFQGLGVTGIPQVKNQPEGMFCRAGLSLIREGSISAESFLEAFMDSANKVNTGYDKHLWLQIWLSLERYIKETLSYSDCENSELCNMIVQNNPVSRHSSIYRELYHPHYRVIYKPFLIDLLQDTSQTSPSTP